jgi:FAD/FMN-containing dehydrogenase
VQNYVDIQQWFDGGVPHGLHYHCRSEWLNPLDAEAIDAAQTWERLVAAKRKYDPANLFRMNQNIKPD